MKISGLPLYAGFVSENTFVSNKSNLHEKGNILQDSFQFSKIKKYETKGIKLCYTNAFVRNDRVECSILLGLLHTKYNR